MERKPVETTGQARWGIRFTGVVQGVGFRPLVSVIAHELGLTGFVYNDAAGVYVEVQGDETLLRTFVEAVQARKAPTARIDDTVITVHPVTDETAFLILPSPAGDTMSTFIGADTAPCEACLRELTDPEDRRYGYSFINCTHCGPRYTIIEKAPYDRQFTTMAPFTMCSPCQAEYDDLHGRRYHAEPTACGVCGPRYSLLDAQGNVVECGLDNAEEDVFAVVRNHIANGDIVAIKGIGGYHLVCDARNAKAIDRLRQRKRRPDKPLAVMAGSLATAKTVACISEAEEAVLTGPERPIVLLETLHASKAACRRRPERMRAGEETIMDAVGPGGIAWEAVAPGNHYIGIMLPYAPVHHLLVPKDALWVMTSGNYSGDTVIYEDEAALRTLTGVADWFLVHNRRIVSPVDDSVVAVVNDEPLLFRRSRGYVPLSLTMAVGGQAPSSEKETVKRDAQPYRMPTILAMGGDLKHVFAINKGREVLPGPHIGDLANEVTNEAMEHAIARYEQLFTLTPDAVVADKNPQYYSSRYGRAYAADKGIPYLEVQHHHAHIAAVMAEHQLEGPVLGVAFDGTGYGDDGDIWGGEFMLCEGSRYERLVHLARTPLPGGERAVEEPWRQALWYLRRTCGETLPGPYEAWREDLPYGWELVDQLFKSKMPQLWTTSAGRLFDAVGSLLGLGYRHSYDSQIAMALEQLAYSKRGNLYDFYYDGSVLDFYPLVRQIIEGRIKGVARSTLAASFHRTLAYGITEVAEDLCSRYGIQTIVLGGGVFQNRRLLVEMARMEPTYRVILPKKIPVNDGGLAVGQWWLAMKQLTEKE